MPNGREAASLRRLFLRRAVGRQAVGREAAVERGHGAGFEMALAGTHQDHRCGGDNGAAVVGPGWAADRPGRGVVVEESLAEMVERQPATIGGKLLAHALVAIDRAWRLGEARVLHLGAR